MTQLTVAKLATVERLEGPGMIPEVTASLGRAVVRVRIASREVSCSAYSIEEIYTLPELYIVAWRARLDWLREILAGDGELPTPKED